MPSPLERVADAVDWLHRSSNGRVTWLLAPFIDKDPLRLVRLVCLTLFCLPGLFHTDAWSARLNQSLMIWFHEGGHGLFFAIDHWGFWGHFIAIAGGSAAQIAVPALFMGAAYAGGHRFNASLMFLWLGLNFVSVSIYAADARDRAMPLIFGLGAENHDWGNMLTMLNLLPYTTLIALVIWLMGPVCFVAALVCGFVTAKRD